MSPVWSVPLAPSPGSLYELHTGQARDGDLALCPGSCAPLRPFAERAFVPSDCREA